MLEQGEQSIDEGSSVYADELKENIEQWKEERHGPDIWNKSMDKPLFPDE